MAKPKLDNEVFSGILGSWYQIDKRSINGKMYYLYESEQYGDELPCVACNSKAEVVLANCWNGLDDVEEMLE